MDFLELNISDKACLTFFVSDLHAVVAIIHAFFSDADRKTQL